MWVYISRRHSTDKICPFSGIPIFIFVKWIHSTDWFAPKCGFRTAKLNSFDVLFPEFPVMSLLSYLERSCTTLSLFELLVMSAILLPFFNVYLVFQERHFSVEDKGMGCLLVSAFVPRRINQLKICHFITSP